MCVCVNRDFLQSGRVWAAPRFRGVCEGERMRWRVYEVWSALHCKFDWVKFDPRTVLIINRPYSSDSQSLMMVPQFSNRSGATGRSISYVGPIHVFTIVPNDRKCVIPCYCMGCFRPMSATISFIIYCFVL